MATLDELVDDVYGDLDGRGTCSVPQVLAPGAVYRCSIVEYVASSSAGLHENIVAMDWQNEAGQRFAANADAEVPISAPAAATGCLHCPLKITFRRPQNYLAVAAVLALPPTFDPSGVGVSLVVENANGNIASYSVLPGELTKRGRHYTFKDRAARKLGGLSKVDMFYHKSQKQYRIKLRAFGDYSAADLAEMRILISVGPHLFEYEGVWKNRKRGWFLSNIPGP